MELQIGMEVKNFRLVKKLGDGASGEVWRARDMNSPREVAIKMMQIHLAGSKKPIHRERFDREIEAVRRLGVHPNIPSFFEAEEFYNRPYFVMEYIRGEGVDVLVYQKSILQISLRNRFDIIAQISDALGFAHNEGYVHRDIKPSNVKIIGNDTAYLLDFSVAFGEEDTSKTQLGIGTPLYMPPEIFPSKFGDIFSLGLVAFEIIYTDHPIFRREDTITNGADAKRIMDQRLQEGSWYRPSHFAPLNGLNVDYSKLDAVFERNFSHSPSERYETPTEFAADLLKAAGLEELAADNLLVSDFLPTPDTTNVLGWGEQSDTVDLAMRATAGQDLSEATVPIMIPPAPAKVVPAAPAREARIDQWTRWLLPTAIAIIVLLGGAIAFLLLGGEDENPAVATEIAAVSETPTAETPTNTVNPTETASSVTTEEVAVGVESPTLTATDSPLETAAPTESSETPTDTPSPTETDTATPTLTLTPSITPSPTDTPTPTRTRTPTRTPTPSDTPEPTLSPDLSENLTLLYAEISDVDNYPCLLLNRTYVYLQEQQINSDTPYAEYGEVLVGNESAMTRIYEQFCEAFNTNEGLTLRPELEEFNDELLAQLQSIVAELQDS